MELTLIRHFKTYGNQERRYIGKTDESLIPDQKIEKKYPQVQMIIVSPMKRCLETADLIYPGRPRILCEYLKECDFGSFEGKNYKELQGQPAYQEWLDSNGTIPFLNGESLDVFKSRCVHGFQQMIELLLGAGCQSAAMVVHGGTIMAILERFDMQGRRFYDWQVENGSGYHVQLDEERWKHGLQQLKEITKL